jgi:hypothetical protein
LYNHFPISDAKEALLSSVDASFPQPKAFEFNGFFVPLVALPVLRSSPTAEGGLQRVDVFELFSLRG